jgi:TRAP-type C4-dicarboxylate transport system substrate-binding protein
MTVLDLPGLPLVEPDVHRRVHDALYKHPLIVAEFKRWNAIPFLSALQPQSEMMGTGEPPKKMEDFKGMRVRALGGTGDALRNLGAVPTSVPAPEVYNGLERGVFRAVAFPFSYSFAAYKINEIGKWFTTNLAPGANNCPTVINTESYAALPAQYKKLLEDAREKAYVALKTAQKEADDKNIPAWKAKGLIEIVYPEAELKAFTEKGARPVWDSWTKANEAKGVKAKELLDFVLAEAAKAKKELGK